ncbi:MAG: DNA cytosine methyltransferase [Acidobacteriota bacterium]
MKMKKRQNPTASQPSPPPSGQRKAKPSEQLAVVDFFCGAGGFTCGSIMAGATIVGGIDCDGRAKRTYQENNSNGSGPIPFLKSTVEELDRKSLAQILLPYGKHPILFIGCPPCQPFTNLRTDKTRSTSSRGALNSFIDHVLDFEPNFLIVENVPGIRAEEGVWDESIERLEEAGYAVRSEVVNAARFGVPQQRYRTLMVASRQGQPPWPEETHSPGSYRTVRDAFEGSELACGDQLCQLEPGQTCDHDPQHIAAGLSELNRQRIRAIKKPGGSRTEWPAELQLECYKDHEGHTDVYGRMDWERPSPTLTTRFVSLSNGRFGHPEEHRAITPREGALIQTFPADYQFYDDSRDKNVIHIGNAVPPLLAKAFVSALVESLRNGNTD